MKNILIVKLTAIGDVIHALPVAAALKERYPKVHLTWVVEPAAYDIVAMNKYIDEIIVFRKKEFRRLGGFLKNFRPLRRQLRSRSYDAVLDLQGLFKSAAIAAQVKAPLKLGTEWMREGSRFVSRPVKGAHADGHIVERYLDVARELGAKAEKIDFGLEPGAHDKELAAARLRQAGVPEGAGYAALIIGASWPTKRWPAQKMAALCDWLYGKKIIPVLTGGGAAEAQLAGEIMGLAEVPPVNLVGATTLPQLAAVYQGAVFALGGDTGPAHLAVALGKRTLMLFGPTLHERNHPAGAPEDYVCAGHPCRGCRRPACPKGLDCMDGIALEAVTERLGAWLEREQGRC